MLMVPEKYETAEEQLSCMLHYAMTKYSFRELVNKLHVCSKE